MEPEFINEIEGDRARELRARLGRVRGLLRRRMLLEGVAWVVGGMVVLGFIGLVFDWMLELSLALRICYVVVSLGVLGFLTRRYVWELLQLRLGPLDVAQALDRASGCSPGEALAPRIATVLQLPDAKRRDTGESEEMIALAVERGFASLEGIDFAGRVSPAHVQRMLKVWYGLLMLPVVIVIVAPGPAGLAARRFLLGSNEPWPRDTQLAVVGLSEEGTLLVPRGEASLLRVTVQDKGEPTERVSMVMDHEDGGRETVSLARFAEGDFRHNLPPIQRPVEVRLRGGDGRLGPITIEPVDRPRVTELVLSHRHARDPAAVMHVFGEGEGNLRLLPDTEVVLSWKANVPVGEARLVSEAFPDGQRLQPAGDGQSFRMTWTHCEPVQMKIELVSRRAGLVSYPVPVAVGLKQDQAPRLSRLTYEHVRQRVTALATIPLKLQGRDDYGITSASLTSRIEKNLAALEAVALRKLTNVAENLTNVVQLHGPVDPAEELEIVEEHLFELDRLALNPGDVVHLSGAVEDDCFTGVQTTWSRPLTFRVVVPEELFREILVRQQQLRARFRKAMEQAESLQEFMSTAALPDDAGGMARDHRLIQREVRQVQRDMEASAEEMRYNRLGGAEALELIERQVLEPMRRLHDLTLTRQREALESQLSTVPEPFAGVEERQAEIVAEFGRILKNMAQWDSFIDVVNQLNTIIKIEQGVNEETKVLGDKKLESIFDD